MEGAAAEKMNNFFVKMLPYQVEALYDRNAKAATEFFKQAKDMGLTVAKVDNEKDAADAIRKHFS